MILVEVSAADIADGVAGDCFLCPVAIALNRATGDTAANVNEATWDLRIEVSGRSIPAPRKVRDFVYAFDAQPRDPHNRLDIYHADYDPPAPFTFELPDLSDPEWEEKCYVCEQPFDPSELDDDGCCGECRDKGEGVADA